VKSPNLYGTRWTTSSVLTRARHLWCREPDEPTTYPHSSLRWILIQGDTKKTENFEKPNKNWRNPTKKIIGRNGTITSCLLKGSNPNYQCLKITSCKWRPPPRTHSFNRVQLRYSVQNGTSRSNCLFNFQSRSSLFKVLIQVFIACFEGTWLWRPKLKKKLWNSLCAPSKLSLFL